jgi:hypothetical protein
MAPESIATGTRSATVLASGKMVGYRALRAAAVALGLYGLLGLLIAAAMLVVGGATFTRLAVLSTTLERERASLVQSLHTASATLGDTATSTKDFQQSVSTARQAADQGSRLANDSAGNFRDLGTTLKTLSVFGIQPLAGLSPQFDTSADQLQQLAITLGTTRDALNQNNLDIARVSADLLLLQRQLNAVAQSLDQPGVLGFDSQGFLPFQIAFYGMCLLVILQSAGSIVVGIVLYRLQRALGTEPLFALPPPSQLKTATTSDERGSVLSYRVRQ